jgi:hypothetical protein
MPFRRRNHPEEHHEPKIVHTGEYHGPDRRKEMPNGRRVQDAAARLLPWLLFVGTLLSAAISIGAGYATTKAAISDLERSKVDKTEFIAKNAEQDRQREDLRALVLEMKAAIEQVTPEVRSLNDRLKQFYCEGKGPSCR